MSWYRFTGSVTNAGTTVTGTLTAFLSQVKAEDAISFDGGGKWYEVESVTDNTHLELATAFAETTVSGGSIAVNRGGRRWSLTSDVAATLADILAKYPLPIVADALKLWRVNAGGDAFELVASDSYAWQPLDADLTAIAALTTASFGRSLLTVSDAADLRSAAVVRERLVADRTYYVRTDGNDSNVGLANTSGGAFLTIQKALDVAATIDFNGYTITIQIGAGTYAGFSTKANVGQASLTSLVIVGDEATPSNVVISSAGSCVSVGAGTRALIKGLKLTSSGGYGFIASAGGQLQFSAIDFGSVSADHILSQQGSFVQAIGNYAISAGASRHINGAVNGVASVAGRTVTITGTPAFSTAFAEAGEGGVVRLFSNTYSGSATGPRYSAALNGVIQTFGAGASALPGDAAGSTATGGQYA